MCPPGTSLSFAMAGRRRSGDTPALRWGRVQIGIAGAKQSTSINGVGRTIQGHSARNMSQSRRRRVFLTRCFYMELVEAGAGIEPALTALQAAASPLCHPALSLALRRGDPIPGEKNWSGKRDSNSRPQPWQGCALPLSYSRRPVHCKRACVPVKPKPGQLLDTHPLPPNLKNRRP